MEVCLHPLVECEDTKVSSDSFDSSRLILGALEAAAYFFPRVERMLTHFYLLLVTESGRHFFLERNGVDNINFEELDDTSDCHRTEVWEGRLPWADVEDIVAYQSSKQYHLVIKNCKHLVYDFMQSSAARGGPGRREDFGTFCERNEETFGKLALAPRP